MRSMVLGLAAMGMLAGSAAQAATLDGDAFTVTYVTSGGTTTFGSVTPPVFGVTAPGGSGQFANDTVTYTFGQSVDFATLGLRSVTLRDTTASRITGAAYEPGSLTFAALSTTADSLTLDFTGATAIAAAGSFLSIGIATTPSVNAVPLPASLPLLGGAVTMLALAGRRRRATRG